MLCLVSLPNGFLLEIALSPKARGQECLDKVCEKLTIIEVDYFGLQYANKSGEVYWLNLRNPIRQQSHVEPIRLALKVKFYVPPYLIQQEATRHQFYLNLRASLKANQLRISETEKQAKLVALIAQAELGNYRNDSFDLKQLYSEWVLRFEGNSVGMENAAECSASKRRKHHSGVSLDGTVTSEDDGEDTGDSSSSSSSLEETANDPQVSRSPPPPPLEKPPVLAGSVSTPNLRFASLERLSTVHTPFYLAIVGAHQLLTDTLPSKAEGAFLEALSELDDIGIDYFAGRIDGELNEKCKIGVGTRGVLIKQSDRRIAINYAALVKVRTSTHFFMLKYLDDSAEATELKFRLTSTKSANALYRVVTEKHVFYSCDTVRDSVATQCILGFTGMFWSITPAFLKDNPEVGKNFVFDIRRTLRQFYDDVQRTMFKVKSRLDTSLALDRQHSASPTCDDSLPEETAHYLSATEQSEEKLLCRICLDRQTCTAFIPCGHVCCAQCSDDCDNCPLCRAKIEQKQKLFL